MSPRPRPIRIQLDIQAAAGRKWSGIPAMVRLRSLLKVAGRAFGWRCTGIRTIEGGAP